VKNSLKIGSVIIVIAYYSFTLGVISNLPILSFNDNNKKTDHSFYLSALTDNYICYAPQKENSTGNTENISESNFKILFSNHGAVLKVVKRQFDSEFYQYSRFSGNLLIQLSKTIIIYPFNYFW
jgi:hypothetical protein